MSTNNGDAATGLIDVIDKEQINNNHAGGIIKYNGKKTLTRKKFENLFAGVWKTYNINGHSYNRNGNLETSVRGQYKFLRAEGKMIKARTWFDIAKALKII